MRPGLPGSLLAAPALLMGLSCATASAAPASKIFRDWSVGCDNLRSCSAVSLPAEFGENLAFLKLTRAGGPDGALKAVIRIRTDGAKAPLAVTMAADGAPFPSAGKRWTIQQVEEGNADLELSASEAEALISVARKAGRLTLTAGGRKLDISLAGSVAALLWLDEQQGRLDTTSALIRKGPSTVVPAAPALPVVTAKPWTGPALPAAEAKALAASLRRHLKRVDPDACEDRREGFPDADEAWALDSNLRLVSLLCSSGAYNFSSGFWLVTGSDVAKARKAEFPQLEGKPDNTLVNAEFAPSDATVTYFGKARGLGDCGSSGTYAWTGSRFALTALSEMGECRGILPEDWHDLFRSELKVAK
jgi:hypothetical protein